MLKYFYCFIFIFFLHSLKAVSARTGRDTTIIAASADTTIPAGVDTVTPVSTDTVSSSENVVPVNDDSLYRPVADSNYLHDDTIREVPHHQVLAYTMNPDYEYANDPRYWRKDAPQKPGRLFNLLGSRLFIRTILLGILAMVLYGVYLLAKENNFSWLYRKGKQSRSGGAEPLPEEEDDFDRIIEKYQAENNLRMAVRYMYLRLIRTAREREIIQIRDSSTNAEITRAFENHPQQDEFRFLAKAYDYIFYGGFSPEKELFNRIKNRFEAFQQTLCI